ncbi:glucose-6-phosphate dehydrogenase [Pengzhenrongella sicca]|uniref:Glucose-6-phosphate dehydrogenase n=1 Tax=Pengzhenrongella sicca TaxID=2819238 RepID=A0A8A4ZJL5_9MICO|nr:glucose-6-phosphate dehydrogenase [Pengzhenrongella sicca]QTE31159.1 glucose-6-phosphate dehydrogenase [Pengzhenrongella sicca]
MITRLALLGATGDLAGRFLLPALAHLMAAERVPLALQVVGGGQQDWTGQQFRDHVDSRLREHAGRVPDRARQALLAGLRYRQVDLDDPQTVVRVVRAADPTHALPVVVYLALPARTFGGALRGLIAADLPAGSRVAVEKPFGDDLAGAAALNALLARIGSGDAAAGYRVDHILAMPAVRELARLRGAGGALEPVWSAAHIDRIEIVWEETLGLEARAAFYDTTGAVKDVMQNHLLQILVLAAMEPPARETEEDAHDAKLALLQRVREPSAAQLPSRSSRARYTAGSLVDSHLPGGRPVPGYALADGVEPGRGTETHAQLILEIDTPRWAGVPFVLRTGKAMGAPHKGVVLHFRDAVPAATPPGVDVVSPRELWIELDGPGGAVHAPGELSAYQEVLADLLTGGSRTSIGALEAVEAWRIFEPVLRGWSVGAVPLAEYAAGSSGPEPLQAPLFAAARGGQRGHNGPQHH